VIVMCYSTVCPISKSCKNVTNLFNKYDACVDDAVCTDVIFCKFADLYRSSYVC